MPSSSEDVLGRIGDVIPLLWLSVKEGIEAYTRDPDHTDRTRANIIRDKAIARLKAHLAQTENVAFLERNNLWIMQLDRGRLWVKFKKMNGASLRTEQRNTQLVLAFKRQDNEYVQPRLRHFDGEEPWADETEAEHLELGYRLPAGDGVELRDASVWLTYPNSISSNAWAMCLDEIVEPAVEEVESQPTETAESPKSEVVARDDLEVGEAETEQQDQDERKRRSEGGES